MLKVLSNKTKKVLGGKSKGMSVQSIIIGSVIAGVIARGGLAMLWPRVDKRKLSTLQGTITEVGNAIAGFKRSHQGQSVSDVSSINLDRYIQSMPNDIGVRLVSMTNTNSANIDYNKWIGRVVFYADPTDEQQVSYLKSTMNQLNNRLDSETVSSDFDYNGKFIYDVTCNNSFRCWRRYDNGRLVNDSTNLSWQPVMQTLTDGTNTVLQQMIRGSTSGTFLSFGTGPEKITFKKLN